MKTTAIFSVAICALVLASSVSARDDEKFFFKKGDKGAAGLPGQRGPTGPRGPPGTGEVGEPIESVLVEAGISLDIETGLLTIGVDGTLACPADFFLASGPFASLTITVDGVDILVPLSLSAEVGADLASVNVEAALGIDLVALLNAELEIDLDLGLGLADILDALAGLGLDLELDLDVNGTVSIICSTVPLTVAVDIDG